VSCGRILNWSRLQRTPATTLFAQIRTPLVRMRIPWVARSGR